jgi:hypothetical protein
MQPGVRKANVGNNNNPNNNTNKSRRARGGQRSSNGDTALSGGARSVLLEVRGWCV